METLRGERVMYRYKVVQVRSTDTWTVLLLRLDRLSEWSLKPGNGRFRGAFSKNFLTLGVERAARQALTSCLQRP